MAWQLIYTSAPRSLEAGRSGFGTVARHRTISPLLVSAIERTSQFSRLPGVDTGRVIFCYRIVAVAGGRFHVLSSIRDAGADYTGRTNHIAHHLIADPREIAQLGANGPSPADVLLAMQWATSWTEQPRFFEATEEIALATIRPTNSSAWQRITGSPEQAWLLASGDASRGAYVIQPAGTDLRTVFAESLRLIPERLWQISFTTSLQPSDEPADFRWIGIEERSPLRAQTESSGRPTLNLAAPDTLPLVEVAQPAAASQIRQSFTQTSAQSSPEGRTVSPSAKSLTPRRTPNERAVEMQSTATTAATHSHRKWWLMAGGIAVIVASVVAFFVGRPLYVKYEHNKAVRAEIDSILNRSEFFSGEVRMELKRAEAADVAKELAEAADRSWQVAKEADFAAMLRVPDKALRERARNANLNTPAEINALDERLEKIATIYQWLHDFQPQPEDDKALDEIKKRRSEADQLTSPTPKTNTFDKIKGVIGSLAEKRRAQVIFSLLNNVPIKRPQPDQSTAWFDEALRAIAPASEDEETKLILKAAQQLIDDWKFADAQETTKVLTDLEQRLAQRPDWPSWLKAKAQLKIAIARTGKAPAPESVTPTVSHADQTSKTSDKKPASRLVFYFFADNKDLSFPLPTGNMPVKFLLRVPGKEDEEVSPYGPDERTIPDKRNLGPGGDYFRRSSGSLEQASKAPKPPYRLIVKRDDAEVAHIFVGQPPKDEALLKDGSIELKPDGQLLGALPEFPPTQEARFLLVNSGSIDGTNATYRLAVNPAGQCDLKPAVDAIRRRIAEKTAQSDLYLKQAKEYDAAAKSPGNVRAKAKQYADKILNNEGKKIFSGDKSDAEAVGTFAMALADQWTPKKGDNPFAALRDAGKTLADALQDKDAARLRNGALEDLISKLASKYTDGDKGNGFGQLRSLCQNLKTALGDSKSTEAEVEKLDALGKDAARDASALQNQPLLRNRLPGGNYTLFAQPKDGDDIKLRTFNLPQP